MKRSGSARLTTNVDSRIPVEAHVARNVRATSRDEKRPPEAVGRNTGLSPGRKAPPKARRGPRSVPVGENRALVLAVSRHRLLSLEQVGRLVFANRTLQAIGQRVGRLREAGWLRTWDQPVASGGRPRFVLPTPRALRWACNEFRTGTRGTPAEALVATMFPARPPLPLSMEDGVTPPFFQHQEQTNDLTIAVATRSGLPLLWSSTWERPLPSKADGITLPQPDAVFLVNSARGPRLVLLEHDRGMEPVPHFRATKTARYADLVARPDLCARLFGTSVVEVWVAVLDAREHRPLRRLEALRATASAERMTGLMRFTLGGWLHAFPDRPVFFPRHAGPATEDLALDAHPLEPLAAGWENPTPPLPPAA